MKLVRSFFFNIMDTLVENNTILLKNRNIFEMLRSKSMNISNSIECCEEIFSYVYELIGNKQATMADEFEISLKNRIKGFVTTLHRKWSGAGRSLPRFKIKNSNWLDLNFNIFGEIENIRVLQPSTNSGRGRPKKIFSESSERSKKRKIKHLAPGSTTPEMVFATHTRKYKSGKRTASKIIKKSTTSTPKTLLRVKTAYETEKKIEKYTAEESLAILIDNKMSVKQYKNIRLAAKKKCANIFSAYDHVLNAKKECYPKNIRITETSCQVPLQDLLDHTIIRILKIPNIKMPENIVDNIELLCKWGCDGSSGHSQYKQTFNESSSLTSSVLVILIYIIICKKIII